MKTAQPSPDIQSQHSIAARDAAAFKDFKNLPDEAFVRLPVVVLLDASSPATIWRKSKKGTFPAPVKLGEKSTGWNVGVLRRHYAALTAGRSI